MNDCIWCFINGCCNGESCNCEKYISANSDEGAKLLKEYSMQVEEYLQPLYDKWKEKMNEI